MPEKKNSRRVKKTQVAKNVKIRGGKDVAPELKEANEQASYVVPNPIKKAMAKAVPFFLDISFSI